MKHTLMRYGLLALAAFALNLPWEHFALPFYIAYEQLGSGWPLALWAAGGDALYIVVIALVVAAAKRRLVWMPGATSRDYLLVAALGFLAALLVEYKALYLHRWAYSAAMPLFPLLGIGVLPLVQMSVFAPLSVWLTQKLLARRWGILSR